MRLYKNIIIYCNQISKAGTVFRACRRNKDEIYSFYARKVLLLPGSICLAHGTVVSGSIGSNHSI